MVKSISCPSCEVAVLDMNKEFVSQKTEQCSICSRVASNVQPTVYKLVVMSALPVSRKSLFMESSP